MLLLFLTILLSSVENRIFGLESEDSLLPQPAIIKFLEKYADSPYYIDTLRNLLNFRRTELSSDDIAKVFNEIANCMYLEGKIKEAVAFIDSAILLNGISGGMLAFSLISGGYYMELMNDCVGAYLSYERAIEKLQNGKFPYLLASAYHNMGVLFYNCFSDATRALQNLYEANEIALHLNHENREVELLKVRIKLNIAEILSGMRSEEAIDTYQECMKTLIKLGAHENATIALFNLVDHYLHLNRIQDAIISLNSTEIDTSQISPFAKNLMRLAYGKCLIAMKDTARAIPLILRCFYGFATIEDISDMIVCLEIVLPHLKKGVTPAGFSDLLSLMEKYEKKVPPSMKVRYLKLMGELNMMAGNITKALKFYSDAVDTLLASKTRYEENLRTILYNEMEKSISSKINELMEKQERYKKRAGLYLVISIVIGVLLSMALLYFTARRLKNVKSGD